MNRFGLSSFLLCLFFPVLLFSQTPDTWRSLGPYPDWPFPYNRHEHASISVNDKFYVIGGRGNKPVQIYDPVQDTWMDGAEPPIEMHHMQLVTLNNLIYVVGAFTGNFPHETPISNIYIYNPTTNQWQTGPSIPSNRRRGSAAAVVYNNKIYLLCGIIDGHSSGWVKYVDTFDPATNNWTTLADAPRARDHFHASIIGDKIYLAGGRRSGANGTFNATVAEVDVYDISENKWTTLSQQIPTKRAGCSSMAIGIEVLVIGGESGTQQNAHDEVEALNTTTGMWRSLTPMKQGRHGMQAFVYKDEVYVLAGSIERGANEITREDQNFIEVYTPDKISTGISTPQLQGLGIYPNPVKAGQTLQLTLKDIPPNTNSFQLRILNLIGQEVVRRNFARPSDLQAINIPHTLKPAAYLLELKAGQKKFLKRLVIL